MPLYYTIAARRNLWYTHSKKNESSSPARRTTSQWNLESFLQQSFIFLSRDSVLRGRGGIGIRDKGKCSHREVHHTELRR